MAQLDLFAEDKPAPVSYAADPERVRRKLGAMLAEVRDADECGLPDERRRFMEVVVPQMVRWLPEEEAECTKRAFSEALTF